VDASTSRLVAARGYHPRGRTVGEQRARDERPALTVVPGEARQSGVSRTAAARAAHTRTAGGRTGTRAATTGTTRTTPTAARPVRRLVTAVKPAPPKLAESTPRLRWAMLAIALIFVVIAGRLVQFQFQGAAGVAADALGHRLQSVDLPAARGSIVDRNGAVLAGSVESRYVFADPSRVDDPQATAEKLTQLLAVPTTKLVELLTPHLNDAGIPSEFEYLARGLSVDIGDKVSALELPGIGVRRDESRVVPGHDLAANLIGFVGDGMAGLGGLEASYDDVLRGVDGSRTYEVGQGEVNLDYEIPGGYHEETAARPGSSVQLTIDSDLQFDVQRILGEQMAQASAYAGSAVVLDVRTGEVLAQASYPFYDAANPLASDPSARGDMASGMMVDPGSIHKAIVFAACLQEGIVAPGDTVQVPSTITKGATTFTDTHWHPPMAAFTLPGILAWSSNVGTITLADRLGADKLYQYQRAFGLGDPISEGLPGEAAGLVQPPANWSADAHGSIPIGLGVSVTPLQMAAVYAAIANGGVYVKPHLVSAIISQDGKATPTPAAPTRQVISAENATALRNMLEAVVTAPDATGRSAAIADYRVAGKTGTGKVVVDGAYPGSEVGSFIGMAPADAPRYVVAVFAYTPGGNGGVVAGPAFSQIMEQTLLHYRVPPSGSPAPSFTVYE